MALADCHVSAGAKDLRDGTAVHVNTESSLVRS